MKNSQAFFAEMEKLIDESKYDEAIKQLNKAISNEDNQDPVFLAQARFYLGKIYQAQDNQAEAIKAFQAVKREDNAIGYAIARIKLGDIYQAQGHFEEAITAFSAVKREDDAEWYTISQLRLVLFYIKKNSLVEAQDHFNNIDREFYDYRHTILSQIFKINDNNIKSSLFNLNFKTIGLLEELKVHNINNAQRKVAHYTRPAILFDLLREKDPSCFRLSSISGVNDPTEGDVLYHYLFNRNKCENNPYLTFISCFTFNHDSLNQFRLYGKEANKEATFSWGINESVFKPSLLIDKSYFKPSLLIETPNWIFSKELLLKN